MSLPEIPHESDARAFMLEATKADIRAYGSRLDDDAFMEMLAEIGEVARRWAWGDAEPRRGEQMRFEMEESE